DCEDYAIAKYFALREVGFGPDELRIVILRDEIRNISHAVLAVYLVDDIMILDNLSDQIFSHSRYEHYVPQYSMNETARWAHVRQTQRKERHAYRGLKAPKQWQRRAMPLMAQGIQMAHAIHPIAEAAYE
ncbi:MAG: transglutaminase-like cysteine peptidase, partial [Proteobacteria bacterium]|nr:transglutaminase-like cysteine peptidase [Pseudomonadota bacterium]